jgi:hypothetical protein
MSRLFDLRLTRHTIWIRKKSYKKWEQEFEDNYVDISNESIFSKLLTFFGTWFKSNYFINDVDLNDFNKLNDKFQALRKRNLVLGNFSWNCLSGQIIFLSVGFFSYLFFLLT